MAETGQRLLIVDDNKVNRLLLSRSVEMLGHQSEIAENGRLAMARLNKEAFDLLLLDIEMPEMDGFEVLEALKADLALRDLPVIVTSSVEGLENIVRCIELGAEDYLPKPVNKTLLEARINSCLEKKRLRDEQRRLLQRFATREVAQDLAEQGFSIGGRRVEASILFCDIRGFTALSEAQTPEESIEFLNAYYTLMFDAIANHGGIVTLMIGDGLMAVFGAPQALENTAVSAVSAAQDMFAMMADFNSERIAAGAPAIRIGAGIATGEVVAGYAGTEARASYTCIGRTVNLAARLEAHTKAIGCELLIDETTKNGLGATLESRLIQGVEFTGFSEVMDVYSIATSHQAN
ncbi:adenylate/guanylate cyclase domain-containing protein [Ruegeria profundi]|uniref:adenylate/guanylate cyclase domain-containing protein n=1 Tax=Ruegeria profundi TaxID=1685378 RepID=UPI001CD3B72E|nr:adenylate/guanylate cyclase domain-containing protein [Ruegeria profundi]MCA0927896.1 response regulator [Ruegeria profundi]